MTKSLRPAWVVANNNTRLINIETGMCLEQAPDRNKTNVHAPYNPMSSTVGTIDEPLEKIIRSMTRQGLLLKI